MSKQVKSNKSAPAKKSTKEESTESPKKEVEQKGKAKVAKPAKQLQKPKRKKNNQVSHPDDYDVETQLCFEAPEENDLPGGKGKYYRVNVYTKNKDGSEGDLLLLGDKCFSFGVQQNTSQENEDEITGHSMSLCLYNRVEEGGATEKQKKFYTVMKQIVEKAKKFVVENKEKIGEEELTIQELRKMDPIYEKDKTKPCLYPKLIESRAKTDDSGNLIEGKIHTKFNEMDENGEVILDENGDPVQVNPETIIGAYNHVVPLVKVESIFLGKLVKKLQTKLQEADVRIIPRAGGNRSMIHKQSKNEKLLMGGGDVLGKVESKESVKEEKSEAKVESKGTRSAESGSVGSSSDFKKVTKKETKKVTKKKSEEDELELED